MTSLNFFESTINVNIMIHKGSHIIVSNNGKILFQGTREYCMNRIRSIVNQMSSLGDKKIIFHIQNMTLGDSIYEYDKVYFKNHIALLNTSSKCNIEVKAGLYNVFA
ncbi:hypothetical protein [Xylanibacter muris]|nr:hypothetical protein [Xylanibacter muris]